LQTDTPIIRSMYSQSNCNSSAPFPYKIAATLFACNIAVFWLLSEVDRIRYDALDLVARQLANGYTGSVEDAACTSDTDKKNIFDMIRCHIREVDHAVEVLISSGMSSASLRRASDLGVSVIGASRFRWAVVSFLFSQVFINKVFLIKYCEWNSDVARKSSIIILYLAWLLIYVSLRIDQKAFMIQATTKIMCVYLAVILFFPPLWLICGQPLHVLSCVASVLQHTALFVVCSVSVAGIDRVASWPFCGPCIARSIVAKASGIVLSTAIRHLCPATVKSCVDSDTDMPGDDTSET